METYSLFPVLMSMSYNTHVDDVGTIQERLEPGFYCGDELGAFVLEHMMPVSRGGGTLKANLCLACRTCNSRKHDRTVEEYRAYLAHR